MGGGILAQGSSCPLISNMMKPEPVYPPHADHCLSGGELLNVSDADCQTPQEAAAACSQYVPPGDGMAKFCAGFWYSEQCGTGKYRIHYNTEFNLVKTKTGNCNPPLLPQEHLVELG